jgi:hypothetical protein
MLEPRGHASGDYPPYDDVPGRPDAHWRDPDARRQARRGQPPPASASTLTGRTPGLWGSRPGRLGVFLVIGCAALGMLATVLSRTEPGSVLGVFVVAGTVAATLAVRPRSAYLVIPVPALAYVVAATIAGLIHDRASDSSLTGLAVHAAQWIASGFLAMSAATLLAIAITAVRWPRTARGRRDAARHPPWEARRYD